MKKLLLVLVVCAVASMANAADIRYMGNGAWETTANWQGGVMPGAVDAARFNWGNNVVTVSTTVATVDRVQAGVDEPGTLRILSGGVVNSGTWTGAGVAGTCTGTITVEAGGTLNTGTITPGGGHLWVGMNDSGTPYGNNIGIVNVSGTINVVGMIGLGTLNVATASNGIGYVNVLNGGVLNLANIHPTNSIMAGSLLTVSGSGKVVLPDGFATIIQNYIDAGKIDGRVETVYDAEQDMNFTHIYSVPEPITLSLLSLGGLLLRKRS